MNSAKSLLNVRGLSFGSFWVFSSYPQENHFFGSRAQEKLKKKSNQEKEKRKRAMIVFLNLGDLLFPEQSYGLRIALSFNLQSYYMFLFK